MKILLYTPNQEKYKAIAALSAGLGVELQALSPADFATPLYKLLGLPPFFAAEPETGRPLPLLYNPPELMLLHAFPEESLDAFLAAYRAAGLEAIAFKAVTTVHNLGWTPYRLAEHIREERAALSNH